MKPYYNHEGITIYHGDCREVLPTLQESDLVLTDPPYGIGADEDQRARAGKQHGNAAAPSLDYGICGWDSKPPEDWIFGLIRSKSRYQIIFGGNYFPLPVSRCWLVWDKQNGTNDYADAELAWTNIAKPVRLIQWRWHGMLQQDMGRKEYRDHPTQKPLGVMKWAIMQAPEDCQTILDPFLGSGTSIVAAKALGKQAIGIEIEEKYCEIAAKRLSQEVLCFE